MSFRVQKSHKFLKTAGERQSKKPQPLSSSSSINPAWKPVQVRPSASQKPNKNMGLSISHNPRASEDYQ